MCNRSQIADISGPFQSIALEGIFGFYEFNRHYVALVVESEKFLSVGGIEIRKVSKTVILPLFRNERILSESKQRDEDNYLSLLHRCFSQHSFYYSPTYDVTHSQQRIARLSGRMLAEPLWCRANAKFFWNREVVLDIIACQADDWIIPFMSAYVEFRPGCEVDNDKFALLFITRRSRMHQGCRYTRRGINEAGYVANYCETEQILIFPDGKITSHVQIRGSIPLLWSSPVHMKYNPKVFIESDLSKSIALCETHMNDVVKDLSADTGECDISCVNLIDGKNEQGKLAVAFKEVIDSVTKLSKVSVEYVWFDFHGECKKKGNWQNLSLLVTQLDDKIRRQGYFTKLPNGAISSWQTGVFRTNCMDNLDRTNVVQSIFARRALFLQLNRVDVLSNGSVLNSPFKRFEDIYKQIWINNANELSMLYAGTGALKTDFTKTGKRTLSGLLNDGFNSCLRYYINNFVDASKQDSIDLLLGNFRPDVGAVSPFLLPCDNHENFYTTVNKALVLTVLTFTLLLLISPRIILEDNLEDKSVNDFVVLTYELYISLTVTCLVVMYLFYVVVKKGSRIGDSLVARPQLVVDSTVRLSKK